MDFETHPIGTAAKLAALEYDTLEAINITDKAAKELLVSELLLQKSLLVTALKYIKDHTVEIKMRHVAFNALKDVEEL